MSNSADNRLRPNYLDINTADTLHNRGLQKRQCEIQREQEILQMEQHALQCRNRILRAQQDILEVRKSLKEIKQRLDEMDHREFHKTDKLESHSAHHRIK